MATASSNDQSSQNRVASDNSTVSPQFKVHIPKECLAATDWPVQPNTNLILVSELVEFGRIRLHVKAEVQQKIDALRVSIEQGNVPEKFDSIGVLHDRYREVTFYTKEKTVLLKPVVVTYLGVTKNGDRQVFVEARKSIIDIMSLEYRKQRSETFKEQTTI